MKLTDFQKALGRLLREQNNQNPLTAMRLDESQRRYFDDLRTTAGFSLYAGIQRSWCIGRAAKSARLTLSVLPPEKRQLLLEQWVDAGGGTHSFYEVESESFLDFISRQLPDPSHELTVCQLEQATLRANLGVAELAAADASPLIDLTRIVRRGAYARLVYVHGDPQALLASIENNEPMPPLSENPVLLMFSPGLPHLWHEPSAEELNLWKSLATPTPASKLIGTGHSPDTIERLLRQGTIEYAK